ncbi:unnamed protein product [Amoebophrya sp. A25]|nr:unnamed protein product [Amoebophrya sp. A25]|eukprot:GSA25T00009344001.1
MATPTNASSTGVGVQRGRRALSTPPTGELLPPINSSPGKTPKGDGAESFRKIQRALNKHRSLEIETMKHLKRTKRCEDETAQNREEKLVEKYNLPKIEAEARVDSNRKPKKMKAAPGLKPGDLEQELVRRVINSDHDWVYNCLQKAGRELLFSEWGGGIAKTSILYAAQKPDIDMCKLLLRYGGKELLAIKDIKNRDVSYYAAKHGFDIGSLKGMGQGLVDCWNYKVLMRNRRSGGTDSTTTSTFLDGGSSIMSSTTSMTTSMMSTSVTGGGGRGGLGHHSPSKHSNLLVASSPAAPPGGSSTSPLGKSVNNNNSNFYAGASSTSTTRINGANEEPTVVVPASSAEQMDPQRFYNTASGAIAQPFGTFSPGKNNKKTSASNAGSSSSRVPSDHEGGNEPVAQQIMEMKMRDGGSASGDSTSAAGTQDVETSSCTSTFDDGGANSDIGGGYMTPVQQQHPRGLLPSPMAATTRSNFVAQETPSPSKMHTTARTPGSSSPGKQSAKMKWAARGIAAAAKLAGTPSMDSTIEEMNDFDEPNTMLLEQYGRRKKPRRSNPNYDHSVLSSCRRSRRPRRRHDLASGSKATISKKKCRGLFKWISMNNENRNTYVELQHAQAQRINILTFEN